MNAPADQPCARGRRRLVRILWVVAVLACTFPAGVYYGMKRPKPQAVPAPEGTAREQVIRGMMLKLRPLQVPIRPPGPNDWLANHKEPGQTFDEYLACEPVTLGGTRRRIYIQPLGDFTPTQRKIVTLTADFMAAYFNTTVTVREDLSLALIPPQHRRAARGFGPQVRTGCILHDILKPRLPADAAAYIAFTASDLYPEDSWNFVFGQASLYERVGVFSLARYGDPDQDLAAFKRCLLRTVKVGTHETGHMFSMYHCIRCECNMNGSNNMRESDEKPLALCPECQAKLCWATGADPVRQFTKLAALCKTQGLTEEQAFYKKSLRALADK